MKERHNTRLFLFSGIGSVYSGKLWTKLRFGRLAVPVAAHMTGKIWTRRPPVPLKVLEYSLISVLKRGWVSVGPCNASGVFPRRELHHLALL